MNGKHQIECEGRTLTLFQRGDGEVWYVEFVVRGQRHRRSLGTELPKAEALAKSIVLAARAGVPVPRVTRLATGEVVEAHGQRATLRQTSSGLWTARVRFALAGQPTLDAQRDLGTRDLAQARVGAANLILRLLAEQAGFVSATDATAGVPTPTRSSAPELPAEDDGGTKLSDLMAMYQRLAPVVGARGGVDPVAARRNCNCLRNIVAEALGATREKALQVPVTTLTAAFARRWKEAWLARYSKSHHGSAEERRAVAIRSGASIWRQARSVFNRYMLAAYRDRGLIIPPCVLEWLREPLWPAVRDEYRPADDETVERTFAAARALRPTDPHERDVAVAFWLAVGAALRRAEIGRIRWDEIVQREGQWWIASIALGKDRERIEVPLLDDAATALEAFREPGKPVLRHTVDRVARWIAIWMEQLGWSSTKKLHELRAWSICRVGTAHGLESARMFARHKDPSLTVRKYGRYLKLQHLRVELPRQ